MLQDGRFDTYLNLLFFTVFLIMCVTMICCCLCFFSNYQIPRRKLARDPQYYKEMEQRVKFKNQELEAKINKLSVGRDLSFDNMQEDDVGESMAQRGNFQISQEAPIQKKYTLFQQDQDSISNVSYREGAVNDDEQEQSTNFKEFGSKAKMIAKRATLTDLEEK